jgi:hypothetical protein
MKKNSVLYNIKELHKWKIFYIHRLIERVNIIKTSILKLVYKLYSFSIKILIISSGCVCEWNCATDSTMLKQRQSPNPEPCPSS